MCAAMPPRRTPSVKHTTKASTPHVIRQGRRRGPQRSVEVVWRVLGCGLASVRAAGALLGALAVFWIQGRADAGQFGDYLGIHYRAAGGQVVEQNKRQHLLRHLDQMAYVSNRKNGTPGANYLPGDKHASQSRGRLTDSSMARAKSERRMIRSKTKLIRHIAAKRSTAIPKAVPEPEG